jgi:hypothetical protein
LPSRSQPVSEPEKRLYLEEHFAYEVRQVIYGMWFSLDARRHKVGVNSNLEQFLENLGLDHFLLHARNLLEFFYYGSDSLGVYARAVSFVPGWKPPAETAWIRMLEKRVQPEVSHLGWDRLRVAPGDKGWNQAEITKDLLSCVEVFLEQLDQKFKSDKINVLRVEVKHFQEILESNDPSRFLDMFRMLEVSGHPR